MKKKLTKEEKELVIKDLLPRIQTGVMIKVPGEEEPKELRKRIRWMITFGRAKSLEDCLTGLIPYLRPMSSMTEKEEEEWWKFDNEGTVVNSHSMSIDWLISHHFDFRGLIPLELAIEAPEGMYA